jgi:hypothetical protein
VYLYFTSLAPPYFDMYVKTPTVCRLLIRMGYVPEKFGFP